MTQALDTDRASAKLWPTTLRLSKEEEDRAPITTTRQALKRWPQTRGGEKSGKIETDCIRRRNPLRSNAASERERKNPGRSLRLPQTAPGRQSALTLGAVRSPDRPKLEYEASKRVDRAEVRTRALTPIARKAEAQGGGKGGRACPKQEP